MVNRRTSQSANAGTESPRVVGYTSANVLPTPTTALSRESSMAMSPARPVTPKGEPAELLRQTLHSAPNSRPSSRSSSRRRRNGTLPKSPKNGGMLTLSRNGTLESSDGGMFMEEDAVQENYVMRHGFEAEYNSEDYLAVLEQVRAVPLAAPYGRG